MIELSDKSLHTSKINSKDASFNVSSQIAEKVKFANMDNNLVPLFPTKCGFEYFVIRTPRVNKV